MPQPINNQGKTDKSNTVYQQAIAPYASGGGASQIIPTGQVYTVANSVPDRSYDAATVAIAELAQVVAALIADLKTSKIIN